MTKKTIARGEKITLSMRVKEPTEHVRLKVGDLLSKGFRAVKPSEMIKVSLSSKEWEKMGPGVDEVLVTCESRRG